MCASALRDKRRLLITGNGGANVARVQAPRYLSWCALDRLIAHAECRPSADKRSPDDAGSLMEAAADPLRSQLAVRRSLSRWIQTLTQSISNILPSARRWHLPDLLSAAARV